MFEIRYRKGTEWFNLEFSPNVEMAHGAELTDPSYILGEGATFSVPKDAEEVYAFFHYLPGEDLDDVDDGT